MTRVSSKILIEDHLMQLAEGMGVEMLMTATVDLVVVEAEASVGECKEKMGTLFDQLPILSHGEIVGVIIRNDIEQLDDQTAIAEHYHRASALSSLRTTDSFRTAISRLKSHEFHLVFDPSIGAFCGLLHYTDLNKQAIRLYCYLWLSALEMALAEYLKSSTSNADDWLKYLDEHRQVTVLGRFEFEKRKNIVLHPIEGVELSDLIRICSRMPGLLEKLEITKSQFDKKTGHVITLRNSVMHPVRTILHSHEEVAKLNTRIEDLRKLVEMTRSAGMS